MGVAPRFPPPDHPLRLQRIQRRRVQPEPLRQHRAAVGAERSGRHVRLRRQAREAQRAVRHGDRAEARVLHPLQRPAGVQVRILDHLVQRADRGAGHPFRQQQGEEGGLRVPRRPSAHHRVHQVHARAAVPHRAEARVLLDRLLPQRTQQPAPLRLVAGDDGDVPVRAGVDVVRAEREPAVPVADARRRRPRGLARLQQAEGGEQGKGVGLQHRDLDRAGDARPLALQQRGDDGAVEVDAGQEVRDRRPGLHRRAVREAGDAHEPRHRLHGQVHRRVVAVGAAAPVA